MLEGNTANWATGPKLANLAMQTGSAILTDIMAEVKIQWRILIEEAKRRKRESYLARDRSKCFTSFQS